MSFKRPAINPLDYTHDYKKNKGGYRLAAVYGSDSEEPKLTSRRLYYLDADDNEVELQSVDTSGPENIYYVEIENGVTIDSANGESFPIIPFIKVDSEEDKISYALYQLDPENKIIGSQLPGSFVSPAKYVSKLNVSIDSVIGLEQELTDIKEETKGKVSFFDTVQDALESDDTLKIFDGACLSITEYSSGTGGGAIWNVVLTNNVTNNPYDIVQSVAIPSLSLELDIKRYPTLETRMFGLLPSPAVSDDVWSRLAEVSAQTGKVIDLGYGEILIENPQALGRAKGLINSGNAKVKSNYDFSGTSRRDNSLFSFSGQEGDTLEISMIDLIHEGEFDAASKIISGIFVGGDYDEVNIYGVHSEGYTFAGVEVASDNDEGRVKTLRVSNCELSKNRSAGLAYGNVDNVSVNGNSLRENGLESDGGTGYGCASIAGTSPRHIRLKNNYTERNYRKGIDCHEGDYIDISHNQCYQDRLWGIYAKPRLTSVMEIVLSIANNQVEPDPDFYLQNPSYLTYRGIEAGVEGTIPETVQINTTVINNECTGIGSNNPDIENKNQIKGIFVDIENDPTANTNITVNGNTVRGGDMLPFDVQVGGESGKTFIDLSYNKYRMGNAFYSMRIRGAGNSYVTRSGNKGTSGDIVNHFVVTGSAPVNLSAEDNDEVCNTCSQVPIVAVATDIATVNNNKFTGVYSTNDLYSSGRLVAKNNFINGVALVEYDSGALLQLQANTPVNVATLLDRGVSGSIRVRWQAQNSDSSGVTFAHGEFTVGVLWASTTNKVAITSLTELYNEAGANTLTPIVMTPTATLNLSPRTINITFQADQVCLLSYEILVLL